MKSQNIKILFLGAGKRLSLLERFQDAAEAENIDLSILSVEDNKQVPIAAVADILLGPRFKDHQFDAFLVATVSKYKIDLVIPNMDAATVALSKLKLRLAHIGCRAVVSDYELCLAMEDKILARKWFIERNLPVPTGDGYPRIVKSRFGYGSREQFIANRKAELELFFSHRSRGDYLDQPLVAGQEYTVDAYVDQRGKVLAALSRKRIEVSDGEVNVSLTHRHKGILDLTLRVLSFKGWEGPITLQFIDSVPEPVIIEVNPRFGGGVTHSINCGLDMPRWLLREKLGLKVEPFGHWADGCLMTRCRRDIFYDNIRRS